MVFSEYVFLFQFLPVALLAFFATPARYRRLPLCALSYLFYGWVRYDFCLLMLASTLLDYGVGLGLGRMEDDRRRRLLVAVSVIGNLGLLAWFKYRNFGIENWNALAQAWSLPAASVGTLVLPVGISFYTFQSMSYTVDVYRRQFPPERNLLSFATYIAMFPQLVAGPIVRYQEIRESLRSPGATWGSFARGAFLFMLGLAKKVLVANSVAPLADALFDGGGGGAVDAWVGLLAYTLQIYFDFSGYSDMAIGLGAMMGLTLPVNFESPYKASSITVFWRRWHITLGSWLRDYLYIPLGGNRRGPARTYVNLAATMLLCGLWHGAQWTFVVWGAFHGALLLLERVGALGNIAAFTAVRRPATFLLVMLGWVFFRAKDLPGATRVFGLLFGSHGLGELSLRDHRGVSLSLAALIGGLLLAQLAPNARQWAEHLTWPRAVVALVLFWITCVTLFFQDYNPFLYFQF